VTVAPGRPTGEPAGRGLARSLFVGLLAGAAVAVSVTLVATVWDWWENPAGLFRNADGTRWDIVAETAWSWLVPAFVYAATLSAVLHAAWRAGAGLRARRRDRRA